MASLDQAHHALIAPLIEPDPSDETGLNTHFRSTFAPQEPITPPGPAPLVKQQVPTHIRQQSTGTSKAQSTVHVQPQHTGSSVETNPYRRSRASSEVKNPFIAEQELSSPGRRRHDYPSPPNSASPGRQQFPSYRTETFGALNEGRPRRSTHSTPSSPLPTAARSRGGSLSERFPGDTSHRPLDTIRKDTRTANRAHHLRKKNFAGADIIDRLDMSGLGIPSYHHEGPYDAANISRNTSKKYSPIAAVRDSNREALRATPRENITDAVRRHRPLEGVATVPSGIPDQFGRVLHYKEGTDLQREPGVDAYKRWPGVDYHPDDLKGKGEPSYTIEKQLKGHKKTGDSGIEMASRRRHSNGRDAPGAIPVESFEAEASGVGRRNTTGRNTGSSLRKRLGSVGQGKQPEV
ncbi:hypothetical protein P153DRAFT_363866 [Dothidotthia symphoricarpi CBS 119687]|uniref:Pal1-domain-containing protein n=1 Tax=Dothidotthia symphoricarpi CBS 119687 TaxID=1392245 RepID=A0A6A6AN02_9PLEO|nr:uncharacterized protein P153DRAFT_363866 [Dothidotthia symphoricarpi CBS 119687]KAF2132563.1 hypothetical protein P153DRAFT_363866 [Dothidotthia symphoricarpi CBS 119687]